MALASENPIVLDALTIRYGSFVAVDGLSLEVQKGECFGLLGPNGAGKTSTFLSLTRQVPVASGAVRLLGFDVDREFARIKPRFGYVPDVENHIDELTAWQNLRTFARLYRVPDERIIECLDLVELRREKDLPVRAFSRGMRKKLLLARELLHRPDVLLLDEPTANLDVHSTELVRNAIRALVSGGVTVLLTTHDMEEVENVCDRVAIVNHGRLIDLDTPQAFKSRNTAREVDVVFERQGGVYDRLTVDLTDDAERRQLARVLESEVPLTIHTREFDFRAAFLRLTGEEYN